MGGQVHVLNRIWVKKNCSLTNQVGEREDYNYNRAMDFRKQEKQKKHDNANQIYLR